MYALLKNNCNTNESLKLDPLEEFAFYISALFSFITTGLALMEVTDARHVLLDQMSGPIQKYLQEYVFYRRSLLFLLLTEQ